MSAWIQSFTGKQVYPLEPKSEQIDPRDIAHALSNICRFTGHVRRFYSVAEHSVRVAEYFRTPPPEYYMQCHYWRVLMQYGLLHDASEAYLTDIASPIKHHEAFSAYRGAEAVLQRLIYEMHGLAYPEPSIVKHADTELLQRERLVLMGLSPAPWDALPHPVEGILATLGWTPVIAEQRFLKLYDELFVEK